MDDGGVPETDEGSGGCHLDLVPCSGGEVVVSFHEVDLAATASCICSLEGGVNGGFGACSVCDVVCVRLVCGVLCCDDVGGLLSPTDTGACGVTETAGGECDASGECTCCTSNDCQIGGGCGI